MMALLTVNVDHHPLADGGRHSVGGDAEVGAHLGPRHFHQRQHLALVRSHCQSTKATKVIKRFSRIVDDTPPALYLNMRTFGFRRLQSAQDDLVAVLASPHNLGFGMALGFAHQLGGAALGHHHVPRRLLVHNVRRDHHLQKSSLETDYEIFFDLKISTIYYRQSNNFMIIYV